jgi:glycerol-3-phosphate dehydrogenase
MHGHDESAERFGDLSLYGSDAPAVEELLRSDPSLSERLHPNLTTRAGEVVWAVRNEMARTVDDFLARRTRSLILDARAAVEAAPRVAAVMAGELGREADWQAEQVKRFQEIAENYLPS